MPENDDEKEKYHHDLMFSELNLLRKSIDEIALQVTAMRELLVFGSTLDNDSQDAHAAEVPLDISNIRDILSDISPILVNLQRMKAGQSEQNKILENIDKNLAAIAGCLREKR